MGNRRTFWTNRGLFAATLILCAMLGGCGSRDYAGISLTLGAAPADLQALAGRARAGDKQAQFDLGERYERGAGVATDFKRALALYRSAAADTGGDRLMFVPQPGGAVAPVSVNTGAKILGLKEAQAKLALLSSGLLPGDSDGSPSIRADSLSLSLINYTKNMDFLIRLESFLKVRTLGSKENRSNIKIGKIGDVIRTCVAPKNRQDYRLCLFMTDMVYQLVQTELNYTDCRVLYGLANSGKNPHSFLFGAVDREKGELTRSCLYQYEPILADISHDRKFVLSSMSDIIIGNIMCSLSKACDAIGKEKAYSSILKIDVEDSLLTAVVRDALWLRDSNPEVGSGWWWGICRSNSINDIERFRPIEIELCCVAGYRCRNGRRKS